jgi:Holliday junction DNA helicase RuvA
VIDRDSVADRSAGVEILLEVAGGVGYRVTVTAGTLSRLPADEPVLLFAHHHVRETEERLYGFITKTERVAFEALLGANGVGPALALAILAAYPPDALSRILADQDVAALCEVSGVGKKTAQRLLVDLQSTLVIPSLEGVSTASGGELADSASGEAAMPSSLVDVREALVNLGYSSEEIRRGVAVIAEDSNGAHDADSGQLLRRAILEITGDRS